MQHLLAIVLALFLLQALPIPSHAVDLSMQKYKDVQGKPVKKKSFTDSQGTKVVLLTQTDLYTTTPNKEDPDFICSNGDLYAYGYLNDTMHPTLLWRMHDYIHQCETSARADFSSDSPVITDLDGNGISEVWITYYISCHGDVSPDGMKILMYEGNKKYALRGETFLHVDGMDMGGKYKADSAFSKAPNVFRKYADKLWRKNMRP